MYEDYYGFTEKPFSLTPDPKYLYRERVARQRVRAAAVRHPPARRLRRHHRRHRHRQDDAVPRAARADRPEDVHRARAQSVPVRRGSAEADPAGLRRRLARRRSSAARLAARQQAGADRDAPRFPAVARCRSRASAVLIIDEAQNLPLPVLEQIRILSNLETDKEKLLQIILVGQLNLQAAAAVAASCASSISASRSAIELEAADRRTRSPPTSRTA